MRAIKLAIAIGLAACLLATPASAHSMSEEIDHLLGTIAASPCAFIRNGIAYAGEDAVAHIKDKYEYYKNDIHSAEDFIALAASKSALSGRPYMVACDGKTTRAAEWLNQELTQFRKQP